jgi:hypothetical protein
MPATLYDFRDLDLMLKLAAEAGDEGWVETGALAGTLGFERARDVSTRLAWMRRYGMLEFDQQRHMWRLSPGGERVTKARLQAAQQRTIEALPEESMVEVMANIASRYRLGSPLVAHMLRREFMYGTQADGRR